MGPDYHTLGSGEPTLSFWGQPPVIMNTYCSVREQCVSNSVAQELFFLMITGTLWLKLGRSTNTDDNDDGGGAVPRYSKEKHAVILGSGGG